MKLDRVDKKQMRERRQMGKKRSMLHKNKNKKRRPTYNPTGILRVSNIFSLIV